MVSTENTASKQIELLKKEFEQVLEDLNQVGMKLATYPRYEKQSKEICQIASDKKQKCKEDLFSMAITSEFQGGKSTTVNALADGREICPSGNGGGGIRTSACAIQVGPASDGETKATILWKTEEKLENDLKYWLDNAITLEDKEKIWDTILRNIVKQLQVIDTKKMDKTQQILMMMTFYQDKKVINWRKQTSFSLEEIRSFLAFPEDNTQRWNYIVQEIKKEKNLTVEKVRSTIRKKFSPENAMHLFIDIVHCATPSEYLQAMGIVVMDTPGLNMSDNDTRVALRSMQGADVIFYLFSDSKQLAEDDKAALRLLQEAGLSEKVFFGLNFRKSEKKSKKIEENILADLENYGYYSEHQKRMLRYNAFLAQRAKQGRLLLQNQLDEAGKTKLLQEAEEAECDVKTAEEAWVETTNTIMNAVKAKGYTEFDELGLCEESIQMVYEASHWEETMEAILHYILQNRGRILLAERVAEPIQIQLEQVETVLRIDEENAKKNSSTLLKQYEDAFFRYRKFMKSCEKAIQDWITPDWDELIAENFYKAVYEECPSVIASATAERIQNEIKFSDELKHVGTKFLNLCSKGISSMAGMQNKMFSLGFESTNNDVIAVICYGGAKVTKLIQNLFAGEINSKLELQCKQIFSEEMNNAMEALTIAWQNSFEDSSTYQTRIYQSIQSLCKEISLEWAANGLKDDDILKNFYDGLMNGLPKGKFSVDSQTVVLSNEALKKITGGRLPKKIIGTLRDVLILGTGIGGGIVGMAALIKMSPLFLTIPVVREIYTSVVFIITAITYVFFSEGQKEKDIEKMTTTFQTILEEAFLKDKEKRASIIAELARPYNSTDHGMYMYRLYYENAFQDVLKQCETLLVEEKEKAKEDAKKAKEERMRIAKDAKDIRETMIAPLRGKIRKLQEKVNQICPKTQL